MTEFNIDCSNNEQVDDSATNPQLNDTVQMTVIDSSVPETLSKRYTLKDGELHKETSAQMVRGNAASVTLSGALEFSTLLKGLKRNQALCYGVTGHDSIRVVTKKRYIEQGSPKDAITRTNDHFEWSAGAGVMMLDYDPQKDAQALTRDELFSIIGEIIPLDECAHVWWTSSSSNIINGNTDATLKGITGQRLYILVESASDIERAGKTLFNRLWLNGRGWFEVGKAGQLLNRSVIDASVWQPSRLDFASGADCVAPLKQDRGEPITNDGPLLDTVKALTDLSEDELAQLETLQNKERDELKPKVIKAKNEWIEERTQELRDSGSENAYDTARRAVQHQILMGDFIITLEGGETVTVGEMLDDPARYHNATTLDPLEPDYNGGAVVGKVYLIGGRPVLHSFAHGSTTYKLLRQPRRIQLLGGNTHKAVTDTLTPLAKMPDIFDFDGQLGGIHSGSMVPYGQHTLAHYLGGVFQYYVIKKNRNGETYEEDRDPPSKMVSTLLDMKLGRGLRPLKAVINAPIITPTGRIITRGGYDAETQLYLDYHEQMPPKADGPSQEEVREAVGRLLEPFSTFPFETKLDRAGFMAALLTAVIRPVLDTAPAFGFDAPTQGSGKTLLAKCIARLSTGSTPHICPHVHGQNDDEIRKRLFSLLLEGKRAVVWDNVLGHFDSASIAALLTGTALNDRVLGKSETLSPTNRMLFVITGNNLQLVGDLPRRFITVRIDPKTDKPFARKFQLNPEQYVEQHRMEMVRDVLTIIKGWFESSDYLFNVRAEGSMASFETWDEMVRQPLCWINRKVMPSELPDIMEIVTRSQESDPEQTALIMILEALEQLFKGTPFTARDVMKHSAHRWTSSHARDLSDALEDLSTGILNVKRVGKILSYRKGRVAGGLRLAEAPMDRSNKLSRWRVERI